MTVGRRAPGTAQPDWSHHTAQLVKGHRHRHMGHVKAHQTDGAQAVGAHQITPCRWAHHYQNLHHLSYVMAVKM